MITTRSVCRNNNSIANDYYFNRLNNTAYTRSQQPIFTSKKSADTKRIERSTQRYEARSNQCPDCNTARSVSGTCEC